MVAAGRPMHYLTHTRARAHSGWTHPSVVARFCRNAITTSPCIEWRGLANGSGVSIVSGVSRAVHCSNTYTVPHYLSSRGPVSIENRSGNMQEAEMLDAPDRCSRIHGWTALHSHRINLSTNRTPYSKIRDCRSLPRSGRAIRRRVHVGGRRR